MDGDITTATVLGFGDVAHTSVHRSGDERVLPGFTPDVTSSWDSGLHEVDHFAVCLTAGQLDPTVEFWPPSNWRPTATRPA